MFDSLLGGLFPLPPLDLFGLKLHAFGFLVGTGIILGTILAQKRAKALGLSEAVVAEVALWAVIPGFIGAHLVHVFFYFPEEIAKDPLVILKFWEGISSFGGFLGGTAGVVWYFKRRGKDLPFLPYADAIIFGFCFAWIFGRMGCTTAFDHPGLESDFFLAMEYAVRDEHGIIKLPAADGGYSIRHNLGFYEMVWTALMFLVFWLNRKRPHFKGWYLSMFVVMYMPVRFAYDFLRAVDERYAGLTPGQWIAIVLFGAGLFLIYKRSKTTDLLVPDGKPRYEYWPAAYRPRSEAAPAPSAENGKKKKSRA